MLLVNGDVAVHPAKHADFYRSKQRTRRILFSRYRLHDKRFHVRDSERNATSATSVQAAILVSVSVLLARDSISPTEMLIIAHMISFLLLLSVLALLTLDSTGQGLNVALFVILHCGRKF